MKKYAGFEVLSAVMIPQRAHQLEVAAAFQRLGKRWNPDYEVRPGFLYVRSRAISSRTNDNYDEFPAEEIAKGYKTFIGKPVFVNHVNDNHRRARGVIIDAYLHRDRLSDGSPDTWCEVLMEVDAIRFPKLAEAIQAGRVDRTSMGTDVDFSICSACGNKATTPAEYCQHIPRLKGKKILKRNASTGKQETHLIREICYGLRFFENSLLVEPPADPTAFFTGVDTSGMGKAASLRKTADEDQCPRCAGDSLPTSQGYHCQDCGWDWSMADASAQRFHGDGPQAGVAGPVNDHEAMEMTDGQHDDTSEVREDLGLKPLAAREKDWDPKPHLFKGDFIHCDNCGHSYDAAHHDPGYVKWYYHQKPDPDEPGTTTHLFQDPTISRPYLSHDEEGLADQLKDIDTEALGWQKQGPTKYSSLTQAFASGLHGVPEYADEIENGEREHWSPGDRAHYEYHCWEDPESHDADLWYRSHRPVTVTGEADYDKLPGSTRADRIDAAMPKVYTAQFDDGHHGTVFEDELKTHPRHFYRPDPPAMPKQASGFGTGNADDWKTCDQGHTHWGTEGAAGLLIHHRDDRGVHRYLLQHRAPWVDEGGTWGIPAGALHKGEDTLTGAMRESKEELGGVPHGLKHVRSFPDDHGGWSFTTHLVDSPSRWGASGGKDADHEVGDGGVRWFTSQEMENIPLHPGFKKSWDGGMREAIEGTQKTARSTGTYLVRVKVKDRTTGRYSGTYHGYRDPQGWPFQLCHNHLQQLTGDIARHNRESVTAPHTYEVEQSNWPQDVRSNPCHACESGSVNTAMAPRKSS